ncbi:hypothetical protein B9Z19DRAFT_984595, partial [Tuber borchii]
VQVYRDGRISREYMVSPRRICVSTPSLGGRGSSTAHLWHVYHASSRTSLAGMRETPGMDVLDRGGKTVLLG